jgi:hypothetical protein
MLMNKAPDPSNPIDFEKPMKDPRRFGDDLSKTIS